jgi:hypothetical protein
LAKQVISLLASYYISTDTNELRNEKKKLATELVNALGISFQKGRLGEFISTLKLADDSARDAYYQTEREITFTGGGQGSNGVYEEPEEVIEDAMAAMLGLAPAPQSNNTESNNKVDSIKDFASVFASNVIQIWAADLVEQSKDVSASSYYGISTQLLLNIVKEFEISAHKTGLYNIIVEEVRKSRSFKTERRSVWMWKQVSRVTGYFNDFIDHAGNISNDISGIQIQTLDDRRVNIFVSEYKSRPLDVLFEDSKNFEQKYLIDWIHGFQYSVRTNADFQSGFSGDIEANSRLGKILSDLRTDQVR